MRRFLKDYFVLQAAEIKKFLRWKERLLWNLMGSVTFFIAFVFVWSAVFAEGFGGIGNLTRETFVVFILSGTLLWEVIGVNLGPVSHVFVREKYMRTSLYFFLSPASRTAFLLAKAGTSLMQILITNVFLISVALYFFDFEFKGSLLLAFLVFTLTFFCFYGLGVCIAALGAWREGIADFSWMFSNILSILSGVWYPVEIFPEPLRSVSKSLPTTQAIEMLRKIGIQGSGLQEILPELTFLGFLTFLFLLLGYLVFRAVEGRAMLIGI